MRLGETELTFPVESFGLSKRPHLFLFLFRVVLVLNSNQIFICIEHANGSLLSGTMTKH